MISLPPTRRRPKGTYAALHWIVHEGDGDSLDQAAYKRTVSLFDLILLTSVNGAGMGCHDQDTISGRFWGSFDQRVLGEKNVCKLDPRVKRDAWLGLVPLW